jgi:cytoskeletal protein RodZ
MEGPPNHPKTFGEEMQHLRESAGLSVDYIAAETKISRQILRNLENGDFQFLPQKIFCRNFVAQYASIVGANPSNLVDAFEAAWERFQLASGSYPSPVVDEVPLVRAIRWRFWGPVFAAAAIAIVAVAVIWRSSVLQSELDAGQRVVVPVDRAGLRTAPASLAESRPTASPVASASRIADEPDVVSLVIRVRPGTECWIHYRDHNGAAGGRLLGGGTVEKIELAGPIKLTVGDAGAASVEVGGKVYAELGRPGQVVHTEVSSDGLEVLGPRARSE